MKLGLISDLHGDPVALELAWAHLTVLGADRILCAGDLVGYGPRPDRVVEFVRDHQIPCVRGNHDRWAVERPPHARDPFGGGTPSPASIAFLAALPPYLAIEAGGKVVVLVHGSIRDDLEFVTRKDHPPRVLGGWLDHLGADVLIFGHTHEPGLCRLGGRLAINPGSVVSAPVVTTSRTFALLDLDAMEATFHHVESGEPARVLPWSADDDRPGAAPPQ